MANIKGAFRYWTKERRDGFRILWETERSLEKISKTFDNKSGTALRVIASEMGVKRLIRPNKIEQTTINVDREFACWLAGFIDGEGCISIYPTYRKRGGGVRYYPRLSIANTNKKSLIFIKNIIGGGIRVKPANVETNERESFQLQINNKERIRGILMLIRGLLKIKDKQAGLVMKFIDHTNEAPKYRKDADKYEKGVYAKIKRLNKRGVRV